MFLAPYAALASSSHVIPNGVAGVHQTIRTMREIVKIYKVNTDVRQAATAAVFLTPEKDHLSEIYALFHLVRDNIRYLQDIHGVETIATPDKTLIMRVGDCDDQTVLLASLLESIGYATRFVVAGYNGQNFEHVYLQVLANGEWINCDPTEHEELGYAPPFPSVIYYEKVA